MKQPARIIGWLFYCFYLPEFFLRSTANFISTIYVLIEEDITMTIKKKTILGIILFILILTGTQLASLYRQPLGPALELPTSTQLNPTLTAFPIEDLARDSTPTRIQPTNTVMATAQPACGGPAVMNILAI